MSVYTAATEVSSIYGKGEFSQLNVNEQNYAYYFTRASVEGSKICLFEVSREAPALFALFHLVFSSQPLAQLRERYLAVGTQENWDHAVRYVGAFLGQLGNYKSFGSTKFTPGIGGEEFYTLFTVSDSFKEHSNLINELWDGVKNVVYKDKEEF